MTLPAPLAGAFAALFLAAALLCTVSLWRRRARHEGPAAAAEANHVVMALAMAAMILPATATVLPPLAGVALFAVIGASWAVRLVALRARGRALGSPIGGDRCAAHPTHLLLSNAAMVAMYAVVIPAGGATAGHGAHAGHGAGSPLALSAVGVALAVYLLVHAGATVAVLARSTSLVVAGGGGGGVVGRVVDAPAVQLGCQAVTGAGMALMLLVH
ncbi:MAG: hypothetical protein K0S40_3059 [Actinomycetospora sp.]|nr:hypothetical protein [Actinomycetospora sp.]